MMIDLIAHIAKANGLAEPLARHALGDVSVDRALHRGKQHEGGEFRRDQHPCWAKPARNR